VEKRSCVLENLERRYLMANAHFVGDPTCGEVLTTDGQTGTATLDVSGKIAGLGDSEAITVATTASVSLSYDQMNPGGNIAPGQSKTTTVSGSGTFESDKNGSVNFDVTASATVTAKKNWTVVNLQATFSDVTISVYDGTTATGTPILTGTC
jgi:hypothetical protein